MISDTYKTIEAPSDEILYKEKGSKFFGYTFPVESDLDVKQHLDVLRKKHYGAGHFGYAYQIGTEQITYRTNDDGEPANSAGMPIYGQIRSFGVTNVLVVVVRFFGGVKLGVGGLVAAYKLAAQMALDQSNIVEKIIQVRFRLTFDYSKMNIVMRLLKENNFQIISQKSDELCELTVSARKNESFNFGEIFTAHNGIIIVQID